MNILETHIAIRSLKERTNKLLKSLEIGPDTLDLQFKTVASHLDFWGACVPELRVIILSPRLYKESDKWLANILTHELGHILANHTQDKLPKSACQVGAFEAEANEHAVKLFSKLYPMSDFYFNHLDTERMEKSKAFYVKEA